MKKQSIKLGIREMIQEVVHNIERRSLLISIILGSVGATLFFLNSLNLINSISITLPELIRTTIFLWAILIFFIYKFMLIRSYIIRFFSQKSLWQFVGWFILISIPFLLIEVQRATQNYIEILIFIIISILMWGLLGLILAITVNGFITLHLIMRQIKLIMVISAIIFIVLYMIVLSIVAAENKLSFLDVIFNWTTWALFFRYLAQVYWFICFWIVLFWSILYFFKQLLVEFKVWNFHIKSKLQKIVHFLVDKLKIHPLFVLIFIWLIFYSVILTLVIKLFDYYSILYDPGIWRQFSFSITFDQFLAVILFIVGAIPIFWGLIMITGMYLTSPRELERISLHNNIQKMLLILVLLFILWWFIWALAAQNLNFFDQNAFVYTDNRTGNPNLFDFLFYAFALLTTSGYGELKPLGFVAHILVMAVTITGLALLVIFVGAALSDKSPRIRRHRKM